MIEKSEPGAQINRGRSDHPFHVIGVTGGIGSGKSTVSGMLVKGGARLIDADALSRQATEPGMAAVREIAERFGQEFVDNEGRLDRAALAGLVFADPDGRKDLERIIHKKVVEAIDACLGAWTAEAYAGMVVLDVPIPVERGFLDVCDEIWVVDGSEEVRAGRVALRNGLSVEAVRARMAAQISREAYCALATRIIRNEGRFDQLEEIVREGLEAAIAGRSCGTRDTGDKLETRTGTGKFPAQEDSPMNQPMFERDLLYPTEAQLEPGSVHISVFSPDPDGRIPVHVEAKTSHDPLANLDIITQIMQSDIFDRIRIDLKKSSTIYLHPENNGPIVRIQYAENGKTHTEKIVHPE